MTIVDQFIYDHKSSMTDHELSAALGVSEHYVATRRRHLFYEAQQMKYVTGDIDGEIQALIALIEERKTGWAVDIAKARLLSLDNPHHQY